MTEFVKKRSVASILTQLENELQQMKPFTEREQEIYRKICKAEISIGQIEEEDLGEWILEREPDGAPYCFHCSVCDADFHYIGIKAASPYCPNCGIKMKRDIKDEKEMR